MNTPLAAYALRMHVRSSFEVFSIAIFALTFGCACVATFILVAMGEGAELADYSHVHELASQVLETLRSLLPWCLEGLDGLDCFGRALTVTASLVK